MFPPHVKQILQSYKSQGFWPWFYFCKRWRDSPFEFVEQFVPVEGTILDVGCGYGLFSNLIAACSSSRRVCGVDIDCRRIEVAQKTIHDQTNIQFQCIPLEKLEAAPLYDAIVFFDVLHHMTAAQQEAILHASYERLMLNGQILIKDVSTRPRYKYMWNYMVDSLTGMLNITSGTMLQYRSPEEMSQLLVHHGFKVEVIEIHKRGLYPHILYRGFKMKTPFKDR